MLPHEESQAAIEQKLGSNMDNSWQRKNRKAPAQIKVCHELII